MKTMVQRECERRLSDAGAWVRWVVPLALAALPLPAQGASIIGLGTLGSPGFPSSALGVSADGRVVVGYAINTNGQREAFRWTAGAGMVGLGMLSATRYAESVATAVSADGATVVGASQHYVDTNVVQAFRWRSGTGLVGLGFPHGGLFSRADAVSADGRVIAGTASDGRGVTLATLWTEGSGSAALGSSQANAYGISGDGSVVVGMAMTGNRFEAFRWTASTSMEMLGDLPGGPVIAAANAVSANGQVVVGRGNSANGVEAFRWTRAAGLAGLGDLPGADFHSDAAAVSADGGVVVGESKATNGSPPAASSAAFYWTAASGLQALADVLAARGADLGHWRSLQRATGLSSDGQSIVGYGMNTNGATEAFLARLASAAEVRVTEFQRDTNGLFRLAWSGATNGLWLEFKSSLSATQWTTISDRLAGHTTVVTPLPAAVQGFYRLRQE